MKTFILIGLVTLCFLAVVQGLQCNVCGLKVAIVGCVQSKGTKTCNANEKCQTIKGYIGSAHVFSKLDCSTTDSENCNVTEKSENTFGFTYNKYCCNTDLCNSASALQLPLLAGFSAMIILLLKLS
ncbi:lymphocyte antigen 6 complex locus protein G6c [Microcaecilia unicolor]|uniref:Lymphocyte antigen 6 complex locus protein G6c n=1 Tax=Microcaecilia unicolor TaxID=1415580 RepID=A0A6P7XCL8_9AMPH|nr:lymphocyte antigen 6 complex locus protein G6c [Microcaecilia unicolor]